MIAQTIQLALAPVFVLVAIGNIMNILSGRLGRVVDRVRDIQPAHGATTGTEHDMIVREIRICDRRITLITQAIRLLVVSGLAIGLTVLTLFVEEFVGVDLGPLVALVFLGAIGLLMWALLLFLREIQQASEALRVPASYLELERDL